jgi:hypothetical protein
MIANRCWGPVFDETTRPKPVYSSPCSKCGSPLDVRTILEVHNKSTILQLYLRGPTILLAVILTYREYIKKTNV